MIFDTIEHIRCYKEIGSGINTALSFLEKEAQDMDETRVYQLGNGITARCAVYFPVLPEYGMAEAHKKYIDVMLMKEGNELIGYKSTALLENIIQEYDEKTDTLLAKEKDMALLQFRAGTVAIWFPQDAHMPGISHETEQTVKRIIVKVPITEETP